MASSSPSTAAGELAAAAPSARKALRPDHLAALTEAGLAILRAPLDVDALCELAYQQVSRLVDARRFHLGLFEKDSFVLKLWVHEGQRMPPTSFPGAQDVGIVGWMRLHQQPLLVHDFQTEMDSLPARPRYLSPDPPRSAIFVPLVAGDEVVGSLSAQHPDPYVYTEEDLHSLGILGNQIASAIVNARLFQTVQRRYEQLAAIAEVGRAIAAILDLDELLTQVVELIRERFGYYHVQVYLVEDESHRAVFRASSGHNLNKLWRKEGRSMRLGEGIIGWVAATGEYLLANDVSKEPRYIADDPRLLPDTRSELAVPLIVEGEVLGVLDVQSREVNAFGEDDLFILNALANQVAVAVDAAWAYRAQQEEAWLNTVLLQIAEVVNSVETVEDVLEAVVRLVPLLTGVASCSAWLKREDSAEFVHAATYSLSPLPGDAETARGAVRLSPEEAPALGLLMEARQPIELKAGDLNAMPAAFWALTGGDQAVLLPLVAQKQLIGCLAVGLDSADVSLRMRDKRLALLTGVAHQVTAAIENVRLTMAYGEEAWTSWALLEVSQASTLAQTEDELLEQLVRLTPLLAGVDGCAVLLREPGSDEFAVTHEYTYAGQGERSHRFAGLRLRPGDLPLLDLAVATGRLQSVDDTANSALVPPRWASEIGSRALVVLPLLVQGEVAGALLVDDVDDVRTLSGRRQDILVGIARQASLALENLRLQAQERERVRMAQELQVARRIQTSLLPADTPSIPGYEVAHTWQSAREVGGDFYDFIPLKGGRWGLLTADVTDKGVPAALFMATSLNALRVIATLHDEPRRVLGRANTLLHRNNRTHMFVTAWYGVLDPARHTVTYANAGHSLALHVSAATGEIRRLRTEGMPLGIQARPKLGQASCTLGPGDALALYTDGVVDAANEAGAEFGQDRLEGVLYGQRHASAQAMVDAVMAALQAHIGEAPIFDDITLVVVRRSPDA